MLELSIAADVGKQFAPFLRSKLRRAHRLLKAPLRQLSLALVNDRTMSELHAQFMGIAGPTDVLTFPLDFDHRLQVIGGEVVLCVPEARRRAKNLGNSVENELLLYAVHGMLHLCGFDDRTDSSFRRMHRKEDEILTKIGVGPVFHPPAHRQPTKRKPRKRGRS
jgi:probable rRNA maturation factor